MRARNGLVDDRERLAPGPASTHIPLSRVDIGIGDGEGMRDGYDERGLAIPGWRTVDSHRQHRRKFGERGGSKSYLASSRPDAQLVGMATACPRERTDVGPRRGPSWPLPAVGGPHLRDRVGSLRTIHHRILVVLNGRSRETVNASHLYRHGERNWAYPNSGRCPAAVDSVLAYLSVPFASE